MEKKNMMLLTLEWTKNNPPPPKKSVKNSLSGLQQQFQREKAATSSKQGQREGTSPNALQPVIQDSKDSAGCHGKCISDARTMIELQKKEEARLRFQK
ncbi:hypothetical protein O181_123020 [Austropuccinia psidii MF-1]|uniref:Uncharacterized protein n=1 Tax=Austropuccinia psidii MF-1 TaxID=1389203 RepID=A0A9Q3KKF3_9BASI|nr:hypothetical protein [Austropuccinia psidii MF-1]